MITKAAKETDLAWTVKFTLLVTALCPETFPGKQKELSEEAREEFE